MVWVVLLEKPDIEDDKITSCLQDQCGLTVAQITFLPLAADYNSAVYRADTNDDTSYLVKLHRANSDEVSATLPNALSGPGVRHIIPPLTTKAGQFWVELDSFKLIPYPFVAGQYGRSRATVAEWLSRASDADD